MRYWWVNQKQTYQHEIGGGYLWSPKRRADSSRNQFYENMKEVAPGDLVFSYWKGGIRACGIIPSFGYDAPKPDEFGPPGGTEEPERELWEQRQLATLAEVGLDVTEREALVKARRGQGLFRQKVAQVEPRCGSPVSPIQRISSRATSSPGGTRRTTSD